MNSPTFEVQAEGELSQLVARPARTGGVASGGAGRGLGGHQVGPFAVTGRWRELSSHEGEHERHACGHEEVAG